MINKIQIIKLLSYSSLLVLASVNCFSERAVILPDNSILAANYPQTAPMTPSMNPSGDMYFTGISPLPGQPYTPRQMEAMQMYGPTAMPNQMPPQMQAMHQAMPPQGLPQMTPNMNFGGPPAALDPNDPIQQALSLHQAGRYADAVQLYESIIINNPPDPRIYASIADSHFRLGNTERALKYAVEALKLDPNYASGHLLIGTILGSMGDSVRAIRAYQKVISLDQNNPYAYYNLGLLYYKKSNIKAALEYLERAKELNPNDPKIWNNLGVAYYDNAQFKKAALAYSEALALEPNYHNAKRNLELVQKYLPRVSHKAKSRKRVIHYRGKKHIKSSKKK